MVGAGAHGLAEMPHPVAPAFGVASAVATQPFPIPAQRFVLRHIGLEAEGPALAFAREGATVFATDLDEKAVALLTKDGVAETARLDVRDTAAVEAVGPPHVLVNCAGIVDLAPAEELSLRAWERTLAINLTGTFLFSQAVGRHMLSAGRGKVINMASQAASVALPEHAAYCASKAGVVGLTRTAALEYVKHGIRVNAVNPGLIDTQVARDVVSGSEEAYADIAKNVPIGRAGRPEEIASAVLWLCSPGASYVVGHALTVDGGMTVV